MSEAVKLDTFPSNRTEALTILYLKNQDLTSVSPEELVHKYLEAKEAISKEFRTKSKVATWL